MLRRIRRELKQGKTLLQFGFLSATGQAFGMIAPLVVAKFFSSAALFGSYSLAKMIVFFFSTLLIASSQTPFIVFASQERAETGRINKAFSVQCTFLILGLCIFAGITIPLNKYVVAFAKIDHGDLLFVLLAFVGLALKTFLCNLFMAMGQRIKRSLAELVFGSLTLILVVLFYVIDAINLRTVFAVYFISALFVLLIFAKAIDINQLRPLGFDRQHFKDMFDFTKWVMLGATAIYFINWGDNLVLRFFASLGDIGSYNLGYQIFKGVTMLTFIIPTYFLPFVSQHIEDSDKIRNYLYNKRPKILAVGAVVIGLLFVIHHFLYPNSLCPQKV
ncbi:MAG: oligosaccharide flippase family protein [Planctomycetota bacterium]|jgi:O-antigen/teichoic acid export membrane protein